MFYFVKSHLPPDKVEDFTRKLANGEIRGVEGNFSYVTPDGCVGYDLVDCRDESDCRQKYSELARHGLAIDEVARIEPMGQFIEAFKAKMTRQAGA